MISIDIPGWGNMEIENVVLDLNGTLATDGNIPSELKKKISDAGAIDSLFDCDRAQLHDPVRRAA